MSDGSLSLASFAFIISLDGGGGLSGSAGEEREAKEKRDFDFRLSLGKRAKGWYARIPRMWTTKGV